jgi:hypothetical protein
MVSNIGPSSNGFVGDAEKSKTFRVYGAAPRLETEGKVKALAFNERMLAEPTINTTVDLILLYTIVPLRGSCLVEATCVGTRAKLIATMSAPQNKCVLEGVLKMSIGWRLIKPPGVWIRPYFLFLESSFG